MAFDEKVFRCSNSNFWINIDARIFRLTPRPISTLTLKEYILEKFSQKSVLYACLSADITRCRIAVTSMMMVKEKKFCGIEIFLSHSHLCVKYFAYFCHKPQSFVCESAWISMTRLRCVRCDFKALSTRFWVEFRTHWNGIKRSHERAREDKKKPLKERKRGKFIYFFFPRRGDC
jgi:hypothetical protein